MLLTISTAGPDHRSDHDDGLSATATADGPERRPATDLGYLLHKHPERLRSVSTTAGRAHVFWPRADPDRATVALLVEIDPVGLVTRKDQQLTAYVNDRPFVASSLLSVAIGRLFRSAMNGDCKTHPELVDRPWPIEARLPTLPVGKDAGIVTRLFGPLGYEVTVQVPALDDALPDYQGPAPVADVTLTAKVTVRDLLRHLYVLIPVLDNDKHYWIGEAEVEKLLRHGEGWLSEHPEYRLITHRYLGHHRHLAGQALDQLSGPDQEPSDVQADADEASIEQPLSLNEQRLAAVVEAVAEGNPATVVDLGCGEGNLLGRLAEDNRIQRLLGVDVSLNSLRRAQRRLRLDQRSERQRPTIELQQSSLTYRDGRLSAMPGGIDVACLVEVIEHLDPPRLDAVEPILFKHHRPKRVVVTTPNREYNPVFDLAPGSLRHRDHRFEWTRRQFADWCQRIADRYDYRAELRSIGPEHQQFGPPTQMAILTRGADHHD